MRAHELDEGWKEKVGAAALGSALTLGGLGVKQYFNQPDQPTQSPQQYTTPAPKTISKADLLKQVAQKVGMEGHELAQFMAQAAHETLNFTRMEEHGSSNYFTKKYELDRRKAKILGNTVRGDGERFKGRGYIQLTGRDNYTRASKAIGIDLVSNPELAARPDVAAKVAIWYWNSRVKPKVDDFSNVKQVTKKINPGLKGLKSRTAQFKQYTK